MLSEILHNEYIHINQVYCNKCNKKVPIIILQSDNDKKNEYDTTEAKEIIINHTNTFLEEVFEHQTFFKCVL